MLPMLTDAQFNSIALIIIALIGIIPTTLAAVWSRNAKNNSAEARENSAQAKSISADALHEVKENGGMSDPDPTLKDYIKFVGESVAAQDGRVTAIEELLAEHIAHSKVMDSALAQVFLHVRPDLDPDDAEDLRKKLH